MGMQVSKQVYNQHFGLASPDYTNVNVSGDSAMASMIPDILAQELEDHVQKNLVVAKFAAVKKDLVNQAGDTIKIHKRTILTATGDLTEGAALEGQEEKLDFDSVTFTPAEKGNAVATTGEVDAKTIADLRTEARLALGYWGAVKMDSDMHTALGATTDIVWGGDATNAFDLDAADTLTPGLISKLKASMQGADVPKFAFDGPEPGQSHNGYYVAIMHPYQVYDLVNHDDYKAVAQNAVTVIANTREVVGPLFRGFDAFWDGVLIFESSNVSYAAGSYSEKLAKGFIMGPRALGLALGIRKSATGGVDPSVESPWWWREKGNFDYGRFYGIAATAWWQALILNQDRLKGVYTAASDWSNLTNDA